MRVVFFGSPTSALPSFEKLLEAGHRVELAVTQPDRPAGRGKRLTACPVKLFASAHGIPVHQPEKIRRDAGVFEAIRAINPDVNVVVAYGQIIPAAIFDLPKYKSLNVHFSLLPKYRGAAPVEWAILNGEEKTGVTIFVLNERMDEGDILAWTETEIRPQETAVELKDRLARLGAELLVQTLEKLDRLPRLPQDPGLASYAPRLKKEDGRINWQEPALSIERKIRALGDWPGAYAFCHGQRILLRRAKRISGGDPGPRAGEVLEVTKKGLVVGCGQGTRLLVERLQRENRREMDAYPFALGMRIKAGDVLE